jgi:heat shock 70kDa protein 1/2/6/8
MSLNGQVPNGSAQAPIEIPSLQTVIGINFGNSFASIAVLTKVCSLSLFFSALRQLETMIECSNQQEGLAECIANEDGERQIACAISFHGEETASIFFPPREFSSSPFT